MPKKTKKPESAAVTRIKRERAESDRLVFALPPQGTRKQVYEGSLRMFARKQKMSAKVLADFLAVRDEESTWTWHPEGSRGYPWILHLGRKGSQM